jgi:hypothetical protein
MVQSTRGDKTLQLFAKALFIQERFFNVEMCSLETSCGHKPSLMLQSKLEHFSVEYTFNLGFNLDSKVE